MHKRKEDKRSNRKVRRASRREREVVERWEIAEKRQVILGERKRRW